MLEEWKDQLYQFRKELHQFPELSGYEENTAEKILNLLDSIQPDQIIKPLGGHGLAVTFNSQKPGPVIMFRCDMDAVAVDEKADHPYASMIPHVSHTCGHDGHMAILCGLAFFLKKNPPPKGKIILLFQPEEETGKGAVNILKDPQFQTLKPDYIFALHNLPGFKKNQIVIHPSIFACASRGMKITLTGKETHAAYPENGNNPSLVAASIIQYFDQINHDPVFHKKILTTIVYAKIGKPAFGTSAGSAEMMITLRSLNDSDMKNLLQTLESKVAELVQKQKLEFSIKYDEIFPATNNDKNSVDLVLNAAKKQNLSIQKIDKPFAWSEDFGHYTQKIKGAMFGIGAGKDAPGLHTAEYDFPDEIIVTGIKIYSEIINQILEK
ncbi:MAG: amidohydrolase [Spirochaetes bacterium]|nr:amidohydrolase [Spirochaetota bacterium]